MDTLGQQTMYFYIHDTLIPQMLEEMDPEFCDQLEGGQDTAKVEWLKRYSIIHFCADTIGIWLNNLSFSYDLVSS